MAIDIFSIKPNVVTRDLSGKSFFIYGESFAVSEQVVC